MLRLLLTIFIIFAAQSAAAQDADQVKAFNAAWFEFVEAQESGSKQQTVDASGKVLELAEEFMPADDERLPLLMNNYGEALHNKGEADEARDVLEEALRLSTSIHGEDSPELLPILMNYADARADNFSSSQQEKYYNQALDIVEATHGKTSTEYAAVAFRAGVRIYSMSTTEDAQRYLDDAYEIYSEVQGADSRNAGVAAFYAGKVEFARGRYRRATDHLLLALNSLEGDAEYEKFVRAHLVQAYEQRRMSDEATEHCVAIGAITPSTPDQDYQPLFRMAPKYPGSMLSAGQQGYVDLEFTVDESGFVRDPVVTDRKGGRAFEKEAIAAAERFRYAPRFEDGEPVAVDGIKTRITFKLVN
jgi:TonB family protein